jgi:hypothetical protein
VTTRPARGVTAKGKDPTKEHGMADEAEVPEIKVEGIGHARVDEGSKVMS